MNSLKDKAKSFAANDWFPLACGVLVFASYHLGMWYSGDDVTRRAAETRSLSDYIQAVISDYNGWSSRALVDSAARFFSNHSFYFFIAIQLLLLGATMYVLYQMLFLQARRAGAIAIVCGLLLFPFYIMGESGWISTSVTYLWTSCCAVISVYPLYKLFRGKKTHVWEYFAYFAATLYVCSHEQLALFMLCVYMAAFVALAVHKRGKLFCALQIVLAVAGLGIALTAPGNNVRYDSSVAQFFPEYPMLGIFDKLEMGFTSTMYEIVLCFNGLLLLLSALCCILIWRQYKQTLYRFLGAFPLACILLFATFGDNVRKAFPSLSLSPENYGYLYLYSTPSAQGIVDCENAGSLRSYFPIVIYGMICICILLSIYLLLGNTLRAGLATMLFALGIGTRIILGFSPSIYPSGERTFSFLWLSIIVILLLLLEEAWNKKLFSVRATVPIMLCLAGLGYADGWMSRYF